MCRTPFHSEGQGSDTNADEMGQSTGQVVGEVSLYAFIQDKKDKHGNVKTYPKVEGDRSIGNPDHWFWAYCWDEKVNGKWKTFKRSVPREKLSKVRMAINANQPVSEILKIIG